MPSAMIFFKDQPLSQASSLSSSMVLFIVLPLQLILHWIYGHIDVGVSFSVNSNRILNMRRLGERMYIK